jgi:geranylgeranyl pyrophosphate synthase
MTNNLFVSYRSNNTEQNYAKLMQALKSLGACIQVQDGLWYINSEKRALEAKEVIRDNIETSDTLIVIDALNNEFEMNRNLREQVGSRIAHLWD